MEFWYHLLEVRNNAVNSTRVSKRLNWEPPSGPKVAGVFFCSGSVESTQEQIVVCVVVGVPDRDVLK